MPFVVVSTGNFFFEVLILHVYLFIARFIATLSFHQDSCFCNRGLKLLLISLLFRILMQMVLKGPFSGRVYYIKYQGQRTLWTRKLFVLRFFLLIRKSFLQNNAEPGTVENFPNWGGGG